MQLNGNEYVADLCCGTGKSTEACIANITTGKILAIDNSKEMLEVAKTKFNGVNVSFSLEDVMELNYPDETFDSIYPEISSISNCILVDFHAEAGMKA